MWLNKLKIAIARKDADDIAALLNNVPKFSEVSEIQEFMYLLKEAISLVEKLKDDTSKSMKQIKKNIDFLKVTQPNILSKLDIIS